MINLAIAGFVYLLFAIFLHAHFTVFEFTALFYLFWIALNIADIARYLRAIRDIKERQYAHNDSVSYSSFKRS
jgi:hypothetical protein